MNIQTEQLENRLARFTVEIDEDRLEKARRSAAKRLARRVNIPGFRKGKAPYKILVQNGLAPQIEMDAVESLSQEVYRETLEQSDIEPYGPGAFEDYQIEPTPTFIYTVPLQPTVELNDYKSIRLDYEEKEVTDEQVDRAMKQLREQEALVEESAAAIVAGNRVTVDIHSEFVDDAPETEESADTENTAPAKGEGFIHEHDAQLLLDPDDDPIMPGFVEAMIGANNDDTVEFELTVPDTEDWDESVQGRKVGFSVDVKAVEVVTLPELNDDFAARVTEDEDEPLTLLQLRMRMRENIQEDLNNLTRNDYADKVVSEIVAQADIDYPDAMVEDQIEDMLRDLDGRLQQQGLSLETYYKITGQNRDDLAEQYHEQAENLIQRSLVLREIVQQEDLKITDEEIEQRLDAMLARFGEQAQALRSMFDSPQIRNNMINEMLQERVITYVVAMAKGEDPHAVIQAQIDEAKAQAEAAIESATDEAEDASDTDVDDADDGVEVDVDIDDAQVEPSLETSDETEPSNEAETE